MKNIINDRIRIRAKKKKLIALLGGQCQECGHVFELYDFHHIDCEDKDFTIGHKDFRISSLMKESNKCMLLCRNCHREIHSPFNSDQLTSKQRIKSKLLDYIGSRECSRCKYSKNIGALDFHHIDTSTKLFEISDATIALNGMIVDNKPTEIVKRELDKCIVLCAQCHAIHHYDSEFDLKYSEEISNMSNNIREIQPKIDRIIVKNMFESGIKPIDIARELKASKGTISDILKEFGLTSTMKEIKEKATISKRIKKDKISQCNNRRKFDPTIEEARELKATLSLRKIGILYGVSQVAVHKRFAKMEL